MEVIPAINVDSFEEVKEKIKQIEPFLTPPSGVKWVQLDVADGTFTKNTIWHNAADLLTLKTKLKIEVHLMINDIEDRIINWLIEPVDRIIFHLEAAKDPEFVIQKIKQSGRQAGIAIGPDTPWTQLMPFCPSASLRTAVDLFQILAVYPGLAGQEFVDSAIHKIKALRENCSGVIIEVDGGINKKVARKCKEAGADIVCSASYIFNSGDVKKAIDDLRQI